MAPKKYDTVIDGKWQLSLPAAVTGKFSGRNEVSVLVGSDGCLVIYPCGTKPFDGERVRLRRGRRRTYARVTIPQDFRNTTSFHYGHTVTVVSGKGCIKLWPRPLWCISNKKGAGRPQCGT